MYTIHNADCMKFMASLPDGHFDVTISDPPYAEQTHKGARSMKDLTKSQIDFPPMTSDLFIRMAQECVRVTQRWVVLTCDWRHALLLEEADYLVRLGVWIKPDAAPQFSGDRPSTGWESIAILHRKGRKVWNGGGSAAVWNYGVVRDAMYPTQKPLPLVKRFISDFSNEGETIFDPFSGSGTVGVGCIQLDRHFVGCEINPLACELAEKRLLAESSQLKLFPYFDEPKGDTTT